MQKVSYLLLFLSCLLAGCVSTPPHTEFAVAKSALLRAKKFQADKLYPQVYLRALAFYKKGAYNYKRQNHLKARNSFETSIQLAEKAEFKARSKKIRQAE